MTAAAPGPVLFAYDGSDEAANAISEAGRQLRTDRDALVLTIWRPFAVEFVPVRELRFNAADIEQVRKAAEETAARGASLAEAAGFRVQSVAVETSPTWKGIVDAADEHDASLIVVGSRGHSGRISVMLGSAALAVAAHSRRNVLIVHAEH